MGDRQAVGSSLADIGREKTNPVFQKDGTNAVEIGGEVGLGYRDWGLGSGLGSSVMVGEGYSLDLELGTNVWLGFCSGRRFRFRVKICL